MYKGLSLLALLVAGCGTGMNAGLTPELPEEFAQTKADYIFFSDVNADEKANMERMRDIRRNVESLATPYWQSAHEALMLSGVNAIPILIEYLDDKTPTLVSVRSASGPVLRNQQESWGLGEVAYRTLLELVGSRTSYNDAEPFPVRDSKLWKVWWGRNRGKVSVYTEVGRIPEHVKKQREQVAAYLDNLYGNKSKAVEKQRAQAQRDAKLRKTEENRFIKEEKERRAMLERQAKELDKQKAKLAKERKAKEERDKKAGKKDKEAAKKADKEAAEDEAKKETKEEAPDESEKEDVKDTDDADAEDEDDGWE